MMMISTRTALRRSLARTCLPSTRKHPCAHGTPAAVNFLRQFSANYEKNVSSWIPLKTSELFEATNETLEAGSDLEADHPGFHDPSYRMRRDKLAAFACQHKTCTNPTCGTKRLMHTASHKTEGTATLPPSDKVVWDMWMSQWHLPSITVALKLNIFDTIDALGGISGSSLTQIANELSLVSDRGLNALLQALVAQGYLEKKKGSVNGHDEPEMLYKCTELSRTFFLDSNPQYYWGNMLSGGDGASERHAQLLNAIQNDGIIGAADEWESGDLTPERADELTTAFHSHSLPAALGAAKKFSLDGIAHLLDVGGGSGCYSAAFVGENQHLHATVMDLPQVCEVIEKKYFNDKNNAAETKARLHTLPKDMFRDAWPSPPKPSEQNEHGSYYDAVFLSNILHDWSKDTCKELLKKSFDTLPSGGKVLIHEILLDSNELTAACFSIHMAVYTRGQQFFLEELKDMLEEVGFESVTSTQTHGYYSIVSATKV